MPDLDPSNPAAAAAKRGDIVVVVEDDDFDADIVMKLLAADGCEVVRVVEMKDALTLQQRESVALIVSDLLLPGGWPDDSLRALSRLAASVPVIVLTDWSANLAETVLRGRSPLKLFDKKSFDPEVFVSMARILMARHREGRGIGNPFDHAATTRPIGNLDGPAPVRLGSGAGSLRGCASPSGTDRLP